MTDFGFPFQTRKKSLRKINVKSFRRKVKIQVFIIVSIRLFCSLISPKMSVFVITNAVYGILNLNIPLLLLFSQLSFSEEA